MPGPPDPTKMKIRKIHVIRLIRFGSIKCEEEPLLCLLRAIDIVWSVAATIKTKSKRFCGNKNVDRPDTIGFVCWKYWNCFDTLMRGRISETLEHNGRYCFRSTCYRNRIDTFRFGLGAAVHCKHCNSQLVVWQWCTIESVGEWENQRIRSEKQFFINKFNFNYVSMGGNGHRNERTNARGHAVPRMHLQWKRTPKSEINSTDYNRNS